MPTHLILKPLQKAVVSLETAIATKEPIEVLALEMRRDSIIQRFEYTYELCWKMMKRSIENMGGRSETDDLFSKKDLYRRAKEAGLITDADKWFYFHEKRNETSHIYDEVKAQGVYAAAVEFAVHARQLLSILEKKYGS